MRKWMLTVLGCVSLAISGYVAGNHNAVFAAPARQGTVPKAYGRLVAAIPDSIGTGLVLKMRRA